MRTVHRRALGFCLGCTFLCLGLAHADVDARHEEWRQEMIHKQARVARDFDELMTGIESLEVLILDNESGTDSDETRKAETTRRIDHWKVMKQFPVTSPTEVALLRSGLKRSIETAMAAAPCFEPRHALLFQKNGAEVQVIICFECASLRINGSIRLNEALISQAALNEFYHVFRAHGLTNATV